MGIITDWGDHDETILVWKFNRTWTAEEFNQAIEQGYQLMTSQPHTVDVICDLQASANMPTTIIHSAQRAYHNHPDNLGVVAILTRNSMWLSMFELMNLNPMQLAIFQFVSNVNDAYAFIEQARNQRAQR